MEVFWGQRTVAQEKVRRIRNAFSKNRRDLLNCDPVAGSIIVNLIRQKIIAVLKYRSLLDPDVSSEYRIKLFDGSRKDYFPEPF